LENKDNKDDEEALTWILHYLDSPDASKQPDLSEYITILEMILRDVEPRIGRYGEQELRATLTKLKSLSHEDAGTDQEEEVRGYIYHSL
jgi:hypothetical protein